VRLPAETPYVNDDDTSEISLDFKDTYASPRSPTVAGRAT
jgi:hypothetical protein